MLRVAPLLVFCLVVLGCGSKPAAIAVEEDAVGDGPSVSAVDPLACRSGPAIRFVDPQTYDPPKHGRGGR